MIETILKVLGWLTIVVGGVFGSLMLFEGAFAAANFLACLGVGIVQLGLAKLIGMAASNEENILELRRAVAKLNQAQTASTEPKEWKTAGGTWRTLEP